MAEFVRQILVAEKKAAEIIESAEKSKESSLVKVRQKTLQTASEGKKNADVQVDKMVRERTAVIEKKRLELKSRYQREADEFAKKAEKNISKGAAFILEKLISEVE